MRFSLPTAELYVPDGTADDLALSRTTHMAIGAHADDLEIMAFHGIQACYQDPQNWFLGVVVTDGGGSARDGAFARFSDDEMKQVRRVEQKRAADLGAYGACVLLDFPSAAVKAHRDARTVADLAALLEATRPAIVYTHNFADKHDTHVAVALKTLAAIRSLAPEFRPRKLYGCEVWRDLDWLPDPLKVALDVGANEELQRRLLEVFASQIGGGKRYDLATLGRRKAHATYHESHGTDVATGLTFAMDLTPLVEEPTSDPALFVQGLLNTFSEDVLNRVARLGGQAPDQ
jgi:LmbE family N-acetylglucosaminyl deacetylase